VLLLAVVAGCGSGMVCEEPNVVIGNVCCIDSDADGVCDSAKKAVDVTVDAEPAEDAVQVITDDKYSVFADAFANAWDRKSYNALSNLFVKDYRLKFSSQEFNFLARKVDALLGIKSVSLKGVTGNVADYEVELADGKEIVSAEMSDEGGYIKHVAFYFFKDVGADTACGDDGACFMEFAGISGDKNYCDKAGDLKAECKEKFGVTKSLTVKIDECKSISEYYTKADCLARLAVNENSIEPCWEAEYDKQIFECMGEVAGARKSVDECDAFIKSRGYAGTRLQKAYCIVAYVKKTSDTNACAKIDRRDDIMLGSLQEGCYKLSFP